MVDTAEESKGKPPSADREPRAHPKYDAAARASRVPELDLLRFIAAASVVLFHYYVLLPGASELQRAVADVGWLGFLGVPLFFMISGFVILWTAHNRSAGEFVLARLCRLYPSFWICVLITSAVFALAGGAPPWRQILANLTMMYHLFGFTAIDQVYWTLFVELKFYGLIAILLACRQLPYVERWMIAWLGLSAVSLLLGLAHHGAVRGLDTIVFEGDSACFALGCYAYLIRTHGASAGRWRGFVASAALSVWAVQRMLDHYFPLATPAAHLTVSVAILLACGAMLAIATRRLTLPETRLWYWLGSLTYPLYLLHAMAGKALFGMLPASWDVWVRIAVVLSAVVAMATVLAVTIEQRGCGALYKRLREILWGRKQRLAAPSPARPCTQHAGEDAPQYERP